MVRNWNFKVKIPELQCSAKVSSAVFLKWQVLLLRTWSSASVQGNFSEPKHTLCNRLEYNVCTFASIGLSVIPMHLSRNAESKRKNISRLGYSFPSSHPCSFSNVNSQFSCWSGFFIKKSTCNFGAGCFSSTATSMDLMDFENLVMIHRIALVDSRSRLLSVTSMLESKHVSVHSFNIFEIPKFKLCIGSKVKRTYKPDFAPSMKYTSFRNDFHGERDHASTQLLI